MINRYLATILVTSLLSTPAVATAKKAHPSRPVVTPVTGPLYSKRALLRAKLLIQMEMLELRQARLNRVREAVRRNLPPDLRN